MPDGTPQKLSAVHLRYTITQAHHDVLDAMLRADVILTPYQRQGVYKALDALRKAQGALVETGEMRATAKGARA